MHGLFARPASGASVAIATFWALVFLTDGLMRLLLVDDHWLIRALGTDIVPQTARIFAGMGWPLGKVRLIVPFAGAWEIAIAMFLLCALYEQMTHDSDDLVPGSAMLILGLSMAVTTVAIVLVTAVLARETAPVLSVLWWPTALLLARGRDCRAPPCGGAPAVAGGAPSRAARTASPALIRAIRADQVLMPSSAKTSFASFTAVLAAGTPA